MFCVVTTLLQVKLSEKSTSNDLILQPLLNTHVFIRAVDDCGAVQLNE
jgi:hypothetical protein